MYVTAVGGTLRASQLALTHVTPLILCLLFYLIPCSYFLLLIWDLGWSWLCGVCAGLEHQLGRRLPPRLLRQRRRLLCLRGHFPCHLACGEEPPQASALHDSRLGHILFLFLASLFISFSVLTPHFL